MSWKRPSSLCLTGKVFFEVFCKYSTKRQLAQSQTIWPKSPQWRWQIYLQTFLTVRFVSYISLSIDWHTGFALTAVNRKNGKSDRRRLTITNLVHSYCAICWNVCVCKVCVSKLKYRSIMCRFCGFNSFLLFMYSFLEEK